MDLLRLTDIQHCIHCGLCIQSCPTYVETGNEALSPRGRIYSLRAVAEGRLKWDDVRPQLDTCLGCLACETACPSPVPYETMLNVARVELERRLPLHQKLLRRMMLAVASSAGLMSLSSELTERAPALGTLLGKAVGGAPLPHIAKKSVGDIPSLFPAVCERRGTVTLLPGCVQRVALPEVNVAAARVLAANGFDVNLPAEPECCGALMAHFGYPDTAERQASDAASAWRGVEALVTTSGGCGAYIKEHGLAPVEDFAEFLVRRSWTARLQTRPAPLRVAMHDSCHLEHGQGVKDAPRELLRMIPGVEPVELDETYCCGSAGMYNVYQPKMARRLLNRKLDAIARTGADVVLSSNPGCTLWIRQGLAERGIDMPVLHLAEILATRLA